MNYHWTMTNPPVHIYFGKSWESRFKILFYDICDKLMMPLHTMLFSKTSPQFSEEGCRALQGMGDWYVEEYHSYICIYILNDTPPLLSFFILDRLLAKEIEYQTGVRGIVTSLLVNSKKVCPTFSKG